MTPGLPELEIEWGCFRVILEGHATLGEMDHLSIDDVQLMFFAMDAWNKARPGTPEEKPEPPSTDRWISEE